MAFDRTLFSKKLKSYRQQFEVNVPELSRSTGIPKERIELLEKKQSDPTGDEVLILADFFKCDYRFFVSNEPLAPFEQTELLFRKHGESFSKEDRWAIQEFLYLCECEEFLLVELGRRREQFQFQKSGFYFKGHGKDASFALRRHLGYRANEVPQDVFKDFSRIGFHVFRRHLVESSISGIYVKHPYAGPCILVNYSEDLYRQRFSAAHEAAHAILDTDKEINVSFNKWDIKDLSEVRANAFASNYLIPPEVLHAIPNPKRWNEEKTLEWAKRLMVNVEPLAFALKENDLINEEQVERLRNVKLRRGLKYDAELLDSLSPKSKARIQELLKRGLSHYYVSLAIEAYEQGLISSGRISEMLLGTQADLNEVASIFGRHV